CRRADGHCVGAPSPPPGHAWDWSQRRGGDFYYTRDEPRQRHVGVTVFRQPGSNTIDVSDAVHKLLPDVLTRIPPSVHAFWRYDRADTIRASFRDIQLTMGVTLVLVI